jgi:hypothetical protein|tara:strand:- start:909 stop:1349 length:441 start_codon:yes stop_codon:yes gene_type:complete
MFELRPEDRLSEWRKFRKSIQHLDRMEMLQQTTDLWKKAPLVNHYLELDSCDNWPDPWTLLVDNMYCEASRALGMFYTLFLTERFDKRDLSVVIYNSKSGYDTAVIVCEKYALNIHHQDVVNTTSINNTDLYRTFDAEDLNAEQYL